MHELSAIALQTLLAAGAALEQPREPPRVTAAGVADVPVGGRGELSVTLLETPAAGFPLVVVIDASPLAVRDRRLTWTDVVDPLALQPRMSAPFVAPQSAGTFVVRALVSYVVCDGQRPRGSMQCRTRHVRVAWDVQVQAAVDDALPGADGAQATATTTLSDRR